MQLNVLQIIENSPLFEGLSPNLIKEIASSATSRFLGAGESVYQKGDQADALWGVISGHIVVKIGNNEGKEMALCVYGKGEVFGEVSMLDFGPHLVEARAIQKSELFCIERKRFLSFLQKSPELCFRMFSLLCSHMRKTTEILEDTALYKLHNRLAKRLVLMAAESRANGSMIIKVGQFELANMLGVNREAVNRNLRKLEQDGLISLKRQNVEVIDLQALSELAAPGKIDKQGEWGRGHSFVLDHPEFSTVRTSENSSKEIEDRTVGLLAVDAAEYSRYLMSDVAGTLRQIKEGLDAVERIIDQYGGKIVWDAGDRVLAEFPIEKFSLQAALSIQEVVSPVGGKSSNKPDSLFRMGVHYGQVLRSAGHFYGEDVNTVIGLTRLSAAGVIAISGAIRSTLEDFQQLDLVFLGDHELKNVPGKVPVYSARSIPFFKILALRCKTLVPRRFRSVAAAITLIFLVGGVWYSGDRGNTNGFSLANSRHSIAVLPFVDLSANQGQSQFTDGVHDEILTRLARFNSIKVISRNSVLGYRGTDKDAHTIAQELGVGTIVEGGVQRFDDRFQVDIQLTDATTNERIWAKTYDGELTAANLFAVQTEIANSVAKAFKLELSLEERDQISIPPTENLAAYEAYVIGKHQLARRSLSAMSASVDQFQKAITLDPDFALAYVGLADAYYLLEWYGLENSDEMPDQSMEAVEHALQLNDSLGEAYATLGSLLEHTDLELSEAAFKRSIELSPNYATAYHWYGNILHNSRQLEAAGIQYQKARELDPLSAIVHEDIASLSQQLGQFEMAREQFQKVIKIDPSFGLVYLDFAVLMDTAFGRLDESLILLHRALAVLPRSTQAEPTTKAWVYTQIAHNYIQIGADDKAAFWIEQALDLSPDNFGVFFARVKLQLLRGENYKRTDYPAELLPLQDMLKTRTPIDQLQVKQTQMLSIFKGITKGDRTQVRDIQRLFRNYDLQAGRYLKIRDRYAQNYPELLESTPPQVNLQNYEAAIDLALVLAATGQKERADELLEDSLFVIDTIPRLGLHGYQITDVMIYTLQGKKEKALIALRQAIDMGWRHRARYLLEFEPNLLALHADLEYQAMIAEVKADFAEQLERILKMEKAGELAYVSGGSG